MSYLSQNDPEAFDIIESERRRQQNTLELIASENHASPGVLEASGSVLSDKYAEGWPQRRYYRGCEEVDRAELLAIDRACRLFGAEHANVQPHSGTSANIAVYMAALTPGASIMGMDLAHGGHLSHGMPINYSGIYYQVHSYTVEPGSERLDMEAIRRLARQHQPRMIIAGASAYPRVLDFAAFGEIAREVGALLLADIAHIAGLVAGGMHPSPVPHADFVTTTTHKTLRGSRGAMILCKAAYAKKVDSAVFPGLQGGPFMHEILGKAVALNEALQPSFREYARQIVANARALADTLMQRGWRLVSGGTDNHLMLLDLRGRLPELTGDRASGWLAGAGLVANMNKIPFDPRPPAHPSGLRFGTPAVTTRGMTEPHMRQIGLWIDEVLCSDGEESAIEKVKVQVQDLCAQFPVPNQVQ